MWQNTCFWGSRRSIWLTFTFKDSRLHKMFKSQLDMANLFFGVASYRCDKVLECHKLYIITTTGHQPPLTLHPIFSRFIMSCTGTNFTETWSKSGQAFSVAVSIPHAIGTGVKVVVSRSASYSCSRLTYVIGVCMYGMLVSVLGSAGTYLIICDMSCNDVLL